MAADPNLQWHQFLQNNPQPAASWPMAQSNPMLAMMTMMQQMQQMQQQAPGFTPPQSSMPPPPKQSEPLQHEDERVLAQALHDSKGKGQSYRTAIESLHGYKGHAAYTWKDYYLEHHRRIDGLVEAIEQQNSRPTNGIHNHDRESSTSTLHPEQHRLLTSRPSPEAALPKIKLPPYNPPKKTTPPVPRPTPTPRLSLTVTTKKANPSPPRRKTLNSLCAPTMSAIPPGVPLNKLTGLPRTPSRSPSPPRGARRTPYSRGGNKYTEEDEVFFFRFITYELKRNPELRKTELYDMLEAKVPEHTSTSWCQFWRKHDDVADKIYFNAQLDDDDEHAVLSRPPTTQHSAYDTIEQLTKPHYRRKKMKSESRSHLNIGTDDEDDREDFENSESPSDSGSDDSAEYDTVSETLESTDEEGEELGMSGSAFTMAEMRALAKHIAANHGWKEMRGAERWEAFCEQHPQRTAASWREYYRRREDHVDLLARKYAKREAKRQSLISQRGRPSWALNKTRTPLDVMRKRRERDPDDSEEHEDREKKQRTLYG